MPFGMRVLAAMLAATLQVQTTLPLGDTGVRVAASDLVLPFMLIFVCWRLFKVSTALQWRMPGVWWWLLSISVVMSVALGVGYEKTGYWSVWALVNKWAGWFALAAYFLIGSAIVRIGGVSLRDEFLQTFLLTAVLIAFVNAVAMPWLQSYYTLLFGIEFNRASGAMQNSNAFGFLVAVAALFLIALQRRILLYLPPLLTVLWFTASRGALLALVAGWLAYLAMSRQVSKSQVKAFAIAIAAITVVTLATVAIEPKRIFGAQSGTFPIGFFSGERLNPESGSYKEREVQSKEAATLFIKAPIFGHGLGYFIETAGSTMHNSLLWLLLETGLIGTFAFVGFLSIAVYYLFRDREDPFLLGMVAVSVAFMTMSVTGEFLYQRHLWVLLGLALAVPLPARERE